VTAGDECKCDFREAESIGVQSDGASPQTHQLKIKYSPRPAIDSTSVTTMTGRRDVQPPSLISEDEFVFWWLECLPIECLSLEGWPLEGWPLEGWPLEGWPRGNDTS
jgi:hypothetical protein